jgi:hypothetical protein
MAASANPILAEKGQRDPTLFCTGYKKPRFYLFTRSEPEYVHHIDFLLLRLIALFSAETTSLAKETFSTNDLQEKNRALRLQ